MRGCMPGRFLFPACDPRVTASSADPRSELAASIRAFLASFFLLAAYFVVRLVRDQLGRAVGAVAYALVAGYAKAHLVGAAGRTAFYAHMDLATNLLVVLLQSGVSSRLLARRQGLTWVLALPALVDVIVLGAIAALGAVALTLPRLELTDGLRLIRVGAPLLALLQILTRGFTYGMLTPAINALYTRVTREARYKGKNFIETTVWRFGDVAVTTTLDALRGLGVGIAGLALLSGTGAAVAARIGYRVARSRDLAPEILPPERRAQPTI